jgi:hypothetical protein
MLVVPGAVPPPYWELCKFSQPSNVLDSNVQLPQLPHDSVVPTHSQFPVWQLLFAPHAVPHVPQLLLSVVVLTQLPQFDCPEGQHKPLPVDGLAEQLLLVHSMASPHAFPLPFLLAQLVPLQ